MGVEKLVAYSLHVRLDPAELPHRSPRGPASKRSRDRNMSQTHKQMLVTPPISLRLRAQATRSSFPSRLWHSIKRCGSFPAREASICQTPRCSPSQRRTGNDRCPSRLRSIFGTHATPLAENRSPLPRVTSRPAHGLSRLDVPRASMIRPCFPTSVGCARTDFERTESIAGLEVSFNRETCSNKVGRRAR